MQVQGKLIILLMLGTAVAMAGFAWTFQYMRGREVLRLWGADAAQLIRVDASEIELLVLSPAAETAAADAAANATLDVAGQTLHVAQRVDISKARGLIHARQALIEDASFDWKLARGDCTPDWRYALEFRAGDRRAVIAIDMHCSRVRLLPGDREASIAPIAEGLEKFIVEQLAPPS